MWRKFLNLPRLELRPLSRPSRSQSLYRLSYSGSYKVYENCNIVFFTIKAARKFCLFLISFFTVLYYVFCFKDKRFYKLSHSLLLNIMTMAALQNVWCAMCKKVNSREKIAVIEGLEKMSGSLAPLHRGKRADAALYFLVCCECVRVSKMLIYFQKMDSLNTP
jgi:hypothetical protein